MRGGGRMGQERELAAPRFSPLTEKTETRERKLREKEEKKKREICKIIYKTRF